MNNTKHGDKDNNVTIPKVFFQTNKMNLDDHVPIMIKKMLTPEWKYEFYNDAEVIQFFKDNPIPELPDIVNKFNSFNKGAHKADLFRYYYLYLKGGIFMDADAMIYVNIEDIVKDYSFVSVESSFVPGAIFQGVIGASPKNKIIKEALFHAYNTSPDILDREYLYLVIELYNILKNNNFGYKIKLYEERFGKCGIAEVWGGNKLMFKHFQGTKIIPNTL
jgi:mannosyltransferase OCH1-like enzyme